MSLLKALRRDPAEVVRALQEVGYLAIERALPAEAADGLLADVDDLEVRVNQNAPPNVVHRGATYATHVLARSQTAFDIVTAAEVTGILRAGLGEIFSLAGKRVYETRGGKYMCFHRDTAREISDPGQLDSIVFIFYLNDVDEGEWQFVEGSHRWTGSFEPSREQDDALLARPDLAVRGFKMPKGSLVIYNGRLLHRAKPYASDAFARRSFFFQVNRGPKKGEPILVETGFLRPDLSEDAKMLLGFGRPPRVPAFPPSSDVHLPQASRRLAEEQIRAPV